MIIAAPCKRQAGINSPQMRADDRVIYTSEGCVVELRLEKNLQRSVCALSAKAFSLKAAFGNILKDHIDRLSS